jgi:hypothetical protein
LYGDTWRVSAYNRFDNLGTLSIYAQVTCLRAEPNGLVIAAKGSKFGPQKARVRLPRK